ncbi:MAG: histidine phosphatase family protein [Pseudomonadota bacterium]
MRSLILLRHAKSAWDNASLGDHDRPLAPRGERASLVIGRYLRQLGTPIDLALSSTARRARDTWALASTQLDGLIATETDPAFYLKGPKAILNRVSAADDSAQTIILVGHNPDTQSLAMTLAESGPSEQRQALAQKLPTAALVRLELPIERWADVSDCRGKLIEFITPRMLV